MCMCLVRVFGLDRRSRGLQVTQACASPSTHLDIRAQQTSALRRLHRAGGGRGGRQDKHRLSVFLGNVSMSAFKLDVFKPSPIGLQSSRVFCSTRFTWDHTSLVVKALSTWEDTKPGWIAAHRTGLGHP